MGHMTSQLPGLLLAGGHPCPPLVSPLKKRRSSCQIHPAGSAIQQWLTIRLEYRTILFCGWIFMTSPASGSRCPWRTHGSTACTGSSGISWSSHACKHQHQIKVSEMRNWTHPLLQALHFLEPAPNFLGLEYQMLSWPMFNWSLSATKFHHQLPWAKHNKYHTPTEERKMDQLLPRKGSSILW